MNTALEERVARIEAELELVKHSLPPQATRKNPWVTFGLMAGSEHYNEIVRLGAEYRQQDREQTARELGLECGNENS